MTNTFKKSLLLVAFILCSVAGFAKDPSSTLDVANEAGSNAYYSLDALPAIKDLAWVGYNSTGSGSGGCISETHWKLNSSRTITFKVKNCEKVWVNAYFSKDATTELKYSVNGGSATMFVTNGTLKKTCAEGDFETGDSGEITIVLSANNDVVLGEIRFYKAGSTPAVAVTDVSVQPTTLNLEAGNTSTLTAAVTPDNASNKKVTWSSKDPAIASVSDAGVVKGESVGTTKIIATTVDGGKTAECTVTVKAAAPNPVTAISLANQTVQVGSSASITITYTPSNANEGKQCTWTSSDNSIATVNNGTVTGVKAGTVTITATSTTNSNIKATCTVTVTAGTPVPATDLTIHVPEIYEEKEIAGGYNGTLSVVNGREYEVYYASFTEEGQLSVTVTPVQKSNGITTPLSDYHCKAKDGWLEMETSTSKSNYTMSAIEEFAAGSSAVHKLLNNAYYKMHIKGFDQFSFYGKDNNADASKGKHFEVYVDGMLQPMTLASSAKIRRFDISTGEHVIEVRGIGGSNNEFYGFSLRAAQEPRTKWLKGNDSTQTVLQTTTIKPVTYVTKYNNIPGAETKLVWIGDAATGISITNTPGTLSDTLTLSGTANCPVGIYNYAIVAYYNGAETSRVSGKLNVSSDIKASSDTLVDAYQGEEMEVIEFRYYALSANDVQLTWTNGTPTGITGDGVPNTNKFAISGKTSAKPGIYPYSITVKGSSTDITGYIEVISQNLGENPVLYLYQTKSPKRGYDNDGVFSYLKGKNVNLQPRTTINKLRSEEQYGKFKWILISDDVNADNAEVLEIARGGADLPVLNMKGFTYTEDRLGWGEPDNGSIDTLSNNGQYIYVQQAKHPIFNDFNAQTNSKIKIFDGLAQNGVMPINIDYPGSFALATAYTRNIEDYYKDGEMQTIIHEIPAGERNNKKYICFPLSISSSNKLSSEGKKLLTNIVDYLISSEAASMTAPKLEMTAFKIGEYNGTIDQTNNTVDLVIDTDKYPDLDLKALKPIVSVADPMTHVSPASGAEVDFQYSLYMPVDYVVTDFINRRVYEVVVRAAASQGIEEVYSLGDWVNIYDVFGRKVATTNENIFTMELPKGMYIIVTENGNTLKIMR